MDLFSKFNDILMQYSAKLPCIEMKCSVRDDFLRKVDRFPGVYLISEGKEIIYIGSSGKVDRNLNSSSSSVKSRLTNAYTPYAIIEDKFKFAPFGRKIGTNKPEGYLHEITLAKLTFIIFDLRHRNNQVIAPSALEHILIQSYINQHRKLPKANQKI